MSDEEQIDLAAIEGGGLSGGSARGRVAAPRRRVLRRDAGAAHAPDGGGVVTVDPARLAVALDAVREAPRLRFRRQKLGLRA